MHGMIGTFISSFIQWGEQMHLLDVLRCMRKDRSTFVEAWLVMIDRTTMHQAQHDAKNGR